MNKKGFDKQYKYQLIAEDIKLDIFSNRLKANTPLPSIRAVSVGRFSPFRVGLKTPISVNLKSPMHHVCHLQLRIFILRMFCDTSLKTKCFQLASPVTVTFDHKYSGVIKNPV